VTTTPHETKTPADPEVIPANDVPAFGVQIRFAKRVIKDMLAQLKRRSNGSTTKR
jgi:hypothetical protein